jgi:hypothetical protein
MSTASNNTRPRSGRPTFALLSHACISISLLVSINSLSPSILSALLGTPTAGVGSKTGTLLLADELTALCVYPIAGLVSDKWGVRLVASVGYVVAALGLALYVQCKTFGELVAARVLFAVCFFLFLPPFFAGKSAETLALFFQVGAGTLVTTLSSMLTAVVALKAEAMAVRVQAEEVDEETALLGERASDEAVAPSKAHPGRLAGMMGFASGLGALLAGASPVFPFSPLSSFERTLPLLAVFVFLRLPPRLSIFLTTHFDVSNPDVLSLQLTFYVVALVAFLESLLLLLIFPSCRVRLSDVPVSSSVREGAVKKLGQAVSGLFEGFRLATKSGEVALGYCTSFAVRYSSSLSIPSVADLSLDRLEVKRWSSWRTFLFS